MSFRSYLASRATRVFRGGFGAKWRDTIGLLGDSIQQMIYDATRSPWLDESDGPAYDALTPLGREMSIPQWPVINWFQYRSQLRDAWTTWGRAGSPQLIIDQLALAGFPGAQWFRWSENGSWSEFVIFWPTGTHPVTGPGALIGSFIVGDGTHIGPTGITVDQITTIRGIIKHWKPAIWICPRVIFNLTGWTVGDGHIVGEGGLVIGGTQAFIGAL